MIKKILYIIHTFLLVGLCFNATTANAKTINITTAGALSTLLSDNEQNVKITGPINGTDIKYLRNMINNHQLSVIDLSEAKIVSGGVAYYNTYTTNNDVIGQYMFYQCAKLKNFILPKSVTTIGKAAFSGTGLTNIEIPDCVATVQEDGFAYCNNLTSVVIGKKISKLGKGTFYSSEVKNAYVKPQSVPDITSYLFSSRPAIHVYSDVLNNYKSSAWNSFGTLKGDLENTYPKEKDSLDYVKESIGKYYEDAACTILKTDYQTITDEDLVASMIADKMPSAIISMTLKVKNDSWEKYEKYYRIHDYDVYSDAKYWNKQLKSSGGSYMGNPTGIYTQNTNDLYVFVDKDVPSGATLYMAGCAGNDLVSSATTGTKLSKGVNVIPGVKDALFYIVYTADTKLCNKKLSEWSNIKIHIEGGIVNGYYDVANQTSTDYRAVLKNATHERFTIKGKYSLLNFKTTTYRSVWPKTIDKSIQWFDSITIWQKELLGICESVVAGSRNIAPYNMSGGDAFFPSYYNNPNFAIEGEDGDGGYANSTNYRTSYNSTECVQKSFDVYHVNNHDDWCAGHECGHNNQEAINIEGCTEVSNNLFACMGVLLDGFSTPKGETIATEMNDFAHHVPFFLRSVDSRIRMYYQLYLYYHQACRNTSFYPNLFKALREDPLVLEQGCNKSSLKFVRKVCKVANEDLTDFFNAWGFFEPCDLVIEDYGNKHVVATQADIDKTKAEIAKYTKKNREIMFVEDRAKYMLTTNMYTTAGKKRYGSEVVGQCGNLGQFTDYLPEQAKPSSYTYIQADTLYAMEGDGGVGFVVLDKNDNFIFGSNAFNFCIPSCLGNDFKIYSIDADGMLHETTKEGEAKATVYVSTPGTLSTLLSDNTIHATISGYLNGTDIKYLRDLINNHNLASVNLSQANIRSGGVSYYSTKYFTSDNTIGENMFTDCKKLISLILPKTITKIGNNAFSKSGILTIEIPDNVTSIGGDAFAYCSSLKNVIIGTGITNLSQGIFYESTISEVYSKSLTPLNAPSYFFNSKPTIHVYKSALDAYKEANWNEFGTLVGNLDDYDITTIKEIRKNHEPLHVTQTGGIVMVSDLNDGESVTVYTSSGTAFATNKANGGFVQFNLSPLIGNVAILATNSKVAKIIVK